MCKNLIYFVLPDILGFKDERWKYGNFVIFVFFFWEQNFLKHEIFFRKNCCKQRGGLLATVTWVINLKWNMDCTSMAPNLKKKQLGSFFLPQSMSYVELCSMLRYGWAMSSCSSVVSYVHLDRPLTESQKKISESTFFF